MSTLNYVFKALGKVVIYSKGLTNKRYFLLMAIKEITLFQPQRFFSMVMFLVLYRSKYLKGKEGTNINFGLIFLKIIAHLLYQL